MNKLTIATIQYGLSALHSEEQFWSRLENKIRESVDRGAELIVFPEYLTAHLLSLEPIMTHDEACIYLADRTKAYKHFFERCSREWNVTILGGTHICREGSGFVNKAFIFFPNGRIETQNKLHLTPEERNRWALTEGARLKVIETPWGRIAMLTCYDIEFPELGRLAAVNGVEVILCPSYTDNEFGYNRVRHCAQARAIENQLFVVLAGIVGTLTEERPQVDQGYCQAGVFTPCDFPFTSDGIVQAGEMNEDMIVIAEINLYLLRDNHKHGIVSPFYDRRQAQYEIEVEEAVSRD
ncbi:carbon-nitrogen hydrolase family protein [Paenibacillus baekrokdamisoli]|nr:carbon-nitrogen hydrolase family protein [Paenibacillus baekrokdamisoli]